MDGLPNFITIPLFLLTLITSNICIIWPIKIIQLLFLWPATIKRIFGYKFPAGGDETLTMIYNDVSKYKDKFKGHVILIRIMGFIGATIALAALWKLLNL